MPNDSKTLAKIAAVLITVAQHQQQNHAGKACPAAAKKAIELILEVIMEDALNMIDPDPVPRKPPGTTTH